MRNWSYPACWLMVGMMLTSCGGGGDNGGPDVSTSATPTGATAALEWDTVQDPAVKGYYVYYGKQSPGEVGSCSYENFQYFPAPPATINGLDSETTYFFAVSTYNGSRSFCAEEVSVRMPAVQASM